MDLKGVRRWAKRMAYWAPWSMHTEDDWFQIGCEAVLRSSRYAEMTEKEMSLRAYSGMRDALRYERRRYKGLPVVVEEEMRDTPHYETPEAWVTLNESLQRAYDALPSPQAKRIAESLMRIGSVETARALGYSEGRVSQVRSTLLKRYSE